MSGLISSAEIVRAYETREDISKLLTLTNKSMFYQEGECGGNYWKNTELSEIIIASLVQESIFVYRMIGAVKNRDKFYLVTKMADGECLKNRPDLIINETIIAQIIFASIDLNRLALTHNDFCACNIFVKKEKFNMEYKRNDSETYFVPNCEYLIQIIDFDGTLEQRKPLFDFFRYVTINMEQGTENLTKIIAQELGLDLHESDPEEYAPDIYDWCIETADKMNMLSSESYMPSFMKKFLTHN